MICVIFSLWNRRIRNRTYGGVRGKQKIIDFSAPYSMPGHSFKKGERLSSRKAITSLFQSGRVLVSHPVRIIYQLSKDGDYPAVMAVSIPKRIFKRAVDRNQLKRRIREIYRLYKPHFYGRLEQAGIKIHLVIQYQQSEIEEFNLLENGIRKGLEKIITDLTG